METQNPYPFLKVILAAQIPISKDFPSTFKYRPNFPGKFGLFKSMFDAAFGKMDRF